MSGRASAIDVPVYIVATVPKIDQVDYTERSSRPVRSPPSDARHLALWTGGDLLWATNDIDAAAAGRLILSELRHQYVIAVDSATDANWRRLEVQVRDRRHDRPRPQRLLRPRQRHQRRPTAVGRTFRSAAPSRGDPSEVVDNLTPRAVDCSST